MKLDDRKNGFSLIEVLIVLVIVSLSLSIAYSSKNIYYQFLERKEVDRIKDAMADSSRIVMGSRSAVTIKVSESDMKTVFIENKYFKKTYTLKRNLKFSEPSYGDYKLNYTIHKTMAPSKGGRFFITGEYKNYEIVFTPVVAKFRVEVKNKND